MSEPREVMDAIDADAVRLDELEKLLDTATTALDEAEAIWDEAYDKVAEALRDEMAEQGRKSDPAEHTIVSATRRGNREAYVNLRRAKRAVEKVEKQVRAKTAAMSGRQSELSAMRDELRAAAYQPHSRQPERRAA